VRVKKGEKKKQQKALKKRTERKQAHRQARGLIPSAALYHLHQARSYPIEGCWIRPDWREHGLAVVVIARRQPDGNLVFGSYMVDYYCLGLKDTYYNVDIPPAQFRRDYLPKMVRPGLPLEISANLAHEIIYGAIGYAEQFGFHPHADFKRSHYVLDPPEKHPRTGTVEFGYNGQPFYISGPYDNVEAIMHQLARTAGEDNFKYLVGLGEPEDDWDDEFE
jgi:hypothetical protein